MFNRFKYRLAKFLYRYVLNSYLYSPGDVRISPLAKGADKVQCEGHNSIPEFCNFAGSIKIGANTTLGLHNFFHGNIDIGRYCQIGAYVAIHTNNHPITHLTTYINKNLFEGRLTEKKQLGKIQIGHDVWIGHNAMLVGSFTVGNGAIIAAGAIVTSDVPPYSIVAGVPAKVLRYRFTEGVIRDIEALEWWNKKKEDLVKLEPLFFKDLLDLKSLYS